jgi:transposase
MIALWRYLKKLPEQFTHIKETKFQSGVFKTINIYFQDESRFGLLTVQRRILTIKGVKPLTPYQHKFKNFYLFGAFSPITGTHFTLELPKCNSDCFQLYLDEFSQQNPDEFKIVFLDNGAFHKAKELDIPPNIALLFIPPYSPELNPAEKMWRFLKDRIANEIFKTLDDLSEHLSRLIITLKEETIKSITAYDYYVNNYNDVF